MVVVPIESNLNNFWAQIIAGASWSDALKYLTDMKTTTEVYGKNDTEPIKRVIRTRSTT